MNSDQHTPTRDALMERIRSNQVRMRPRAYFLLKLVALVALTALILVISILLSNLISFDLRVNGHDALVGFGWRGIRIALATFPWWLLTVDIMLLVLLRAVLKAFSFGYKSAWLPLVAGLLLISGIAGAGIDRGTALNDMLLRDADSRRLPPPVNALYRGERHQPYEANGEYRGMIVRIDGSTLYLATRQQATTTLLVRLPDADDSQGFRVGDAVVVLGEFEQGAVRAYGVRLIDPNGVPPPLYP